MNLNLLLEAAKYVDYSSEAKARGEEPHDYSTFLKYCSVSKDGVCSASEHVASKHQQVVSSSSHAQEDVKEKKRSNSSLGNPDAHRLHEHSGTGTREVHNKLKKNRRAHLKECFEALKKQLPHMDDRKTSNLSVLKNAVKYIQLLKKKEREFEHDMERLAREKIAFQHRLTNLRKDITSQLDNVDSNNYIIPEEENETTTTASECGESDFDDDTLPVESVGNSAATSDFASSSSSNTSSVLVAPGPTIVSEPLALAKSHNSSAQQPACINKESIKVPHSYVHETRLNPENKTVLTSISSPLSVHASSADNGTAQPTRVFSTSNLHAMTGIFAAPHAMQVLSQPSGIKVITAPNSLMASNSSVQHISVNHHQHGQIHVLAPSSSTSYASSMAGSPAKSFCADSLVQVAPSVGKGLTKPHLVSPLALVSPQTMVEISHQGSGKSLPNSTNLSDLINSSGISSTLNLSHKGASVLSGNMAIAVKNNLPHCSAATVPQSNMIATLHMSKPHSQVIQPSLVSGIITQGSQVNNGAHHGVNAGLKPIASSPVRSVSHIAGIAMPAPVGQIVAPGNHVSAVTPIVGSVSVVSHTGAVHPQSLGKVLASPVLKSVNQISPIPIIQQQFLQQVSVGSGSQPIVKPVVVVSMPSVVSSGSISPLNPTSLVAMGEPPGLIRGPLSQK